MSETKVGNRSGRILVADDTQANLQLLTDMLTAQGYTVYPASDGELALEFVRITIPDLILLDICMPGIDGYEVCRRLKADVRTCSVPVIFLSALLDEQEKVEGFSVGGVDYITKPFLRDELLARIETQLRLSALTCQLEQNVAELEQAYHDLKAAQSRILQQEKMASIGQLAAGVAHEINNPLGFVFSNLGTLGRYLSHLVHYQAELEKTVKQAAEQTPQGGTELLAEMVRHRKQLKIDAIIPDIQELLAESLEGCDRMQRIVANLMTFARQDNDQMELADLNEGLESTLNIVANELKYKATVKKDYGEIPSLLCHPGQLNQVFMNLLINAAHSIEGQGEITISTRCEEDCVLVEIVDTGCGIPADNLARIFEPFFTTKEVGKGTGLGLSIAYDIIKKHHGDLTVESEVGSGTRFLIRLPLPAAAKETGGKRDHE